VETLRHIWFTLFGCSMLCTWGCVFHWRRLCLHIAPLSGSVWVPQAVDHTLQVRMVAHKNWWCTHTVGIIYAILHWLPCYIYIYPKPSAWIAKSAWWTLTPVLKQDIKHCNSTSVTVLTISFPDIIPWRSFLAHASIKLSISPVISGFQPPKFTQVSLYLSSIHL